MKSAYALSALALVLASPAFAAEGLYIQGNLSQVRTESSDASSINGIELPIDIDPGMGAGVALGYALPYNVRVEAEAAARNSDYTSDFTGAPFFVPLPDGIVSGTTNAFSLMGNVYYDIPTGSRFTPYVGAGLGGVRIGEDGDYENVLAYQGMVGVSFAASDQTSFVLGYKYFAAKDQKYDAEPYTGTPGDVGEDKYRTHNIELGMRYSFDTPAK